MLYLHEMAGNGYSDIAEHFNAFGQTLNGGKECA